MTAGRLPVAGHKASLFIALFYALLACSFYTEAMFWVLILCGCAVIVRVLLFRGLYRQAPGKSTINLLAVLSAIVLAWTSVDANFLHTMVNLLIMACSLKLMLLSHRRDFLQLIVCGLFLLACGIIFNQSLGWAFFYAVMTLVLFFTLAWGYAPSRPLKQQQITVLRLFCQALPLAIITFLAVPQIPPLWQMPQSRSTETGLSESITPGDIAELTQSGDLAFNATFDDTVPAMPLRYWRAFTLEKFDGNTWSVSPIRRHLRQQLQSSKREFSPSVSGTSVNYQIIAEPTHQRWLYGLDVAIPGNPKSDALIWQGWDYQLVATRPLYSKTAYRITSYPASKMNAGLGEIDKELNLQVPEDGNPQTHEWIEQLRERYPNNEDFAEQLMRYFSQQPFVYTLSPPPMNIDSIDRFLFTYRAGFCAHYASAMTYGLRLAGIPARVVSGYHGGKELQPGVLSVYQYDAHAWVEAWIDDAGWQRFDPTGVVAPSRILTGFESSARYSAEMHGPARFDGIIDSAFFSSLKTSFVRMNYLWSRWFLGFDADTQEKMFADLLGQRTYWKAVGFGVAVVVLVLALLYFYLRIGSLRDQNTNTEHQLYHQAVVMVARYTGKPRGKSPPSVYLKSVISDLSPGSALIFSKLTRQFIDYAYGPQRKKEDLRFLKRSLLSLRKSLHNEMPRHTH